MRLPLRRLKGAAGGCGTNGHMWGIVDVGQQSQLPHVSAAEELPQMSHLHNSLPCQLAWLTGTPEKNNQNTREYTFNHIRGEMSCWVLQSLFGGQGTAAGEHVAANGVL